MKLKKGFWMRIIPVFITVVVTVVLSIVIYQRIVEKEMDINWERLEIATKSTASKIQVRMQDNINFLELTSDSLILEHGLDGKEHIAKYLGSVREMTIFERIDVLYPDGSVLLESGQVVQMETAATYESIKEQGSHISARRVDPITGKDVFYCFVPIEVEGQTEALLIGIVECETLNELFQVFTYGKDAQLFMVDRKDGNYLMDNWHDEFGNIYELGDRKRLEGYEGVDFVSEIIEGKINGLGYISRTNGNRSYMYYAPVEGFDWEVCVGVQEDVVFANVEKLKNVLVIAGVIEVLLLVAYLSWNLYITLSVVKSEEKARKLETEKAKNEARSKFLSNMSHDIRTPLNGIVGMLQIIKQHRKEEQMVDDCLEKIGVSTQYLITLANDMLDIHEFENNKVVLVRETIDLRKLLQELESMIVPKAKAAGVSYYMECSKLDHPVVIGSSIHIKRILVNLIGNAIKYKRESDAKVWVSIEEAITNEGKPIYRFIIQDNGIGMSKEFQANMFNAFEQETVNARSDYQGYGLGLTIVNHLVESMHGIIDIASEKGEGTTFVVTLPLEIKRGNVEDKEDIEIVDLTGARILLVEDNEFNLEIAQVLLTDLGADVITAINGKLAVETFAKSEEGFFDFVLMDLMMPELDGCEATEAIRALDRTDAGKVPIIAMTASAFSEEIERCKKAGMNEHIAKPLDMEKLVAQVSKYYKKG